MTRRAAKVDGNHESIVLALRRCGVSVTSLAALGAGVPDLLCATARAMWLVEVKDGSKPPSGRRLTPDQARWHEAWPQPVYIASSVEDVPRIIQLAHKAQEWAA